MAREITTGLILGVACVVLYSTMAPANLLGSRTSVQATNRNLPVPWGQSAGKPRVPKPEYSKVACKAPLRRKQSWTGEWVDPVAMFSKGFKPGRAGKPKAGPRPVNNKAAVPAKTLAKKPWTGNLGSFYEKLVAKGQAPQPNTNVKATSASSTLRYKREWIGSAADALIGGTADAINYLDNPQPRKKLWLNTGDPNGPWKSAEKALPAAEKAAAPAADAAAPAAKADAPVEKAEEAVAA